MENMNYKFEQLADHIANKSISIGEGTKVRLKYKSVDSIPFIKLLINKIAQQGGIVFPYYFDKELEDYLTSTYKKSSIESLLEVTKSENTFFDVFVSLGSNDKYSETPKTNKEVLNQLKRERSNLEQLKKSSQWLLFNYPSKVDSENLNMNYDEYLKYALDAMLFDFDVVKDEVEYLKELMDKTRKVRITGDNVDIRFDKTNIPSVPLVGKFNLPDGEIYTSPIKDSVNGYIKYNVRSPKIGHIFEDISLEFKNGKVVDFDCKNNKKEFEEIISIDDGAKYIGEFAFGFNPNIKQPMLDILYDEKMCRSFHMALGNSYSNAFNGNRSALHWDMIYLNEKGNYCNVFFDDDLVMENGIFVNNKIKRLSR